MGSRCSFAAVALLSGSAYLCIKLAVQDASPLVVMCGRSILGAAILLPLARRLGALRGLRPHLPALLAVSLLEFALPPTLLATGARSIDSSLSGVIMAAGPLFVALLALRMDRSERVDALRMVGLLTGMVGVVCLLGLQTAGSGREAVGAGLVLLASLSFAAGALVVKRHLGGVHPLGVVAVGLGVAACALAVPAAVTFPAAMPAATGLGAIAVLGVFHGALNFALFFALIRRVGAGRAAVTSYVAPAVSVLLGAAVLGEPLGAGLIAGLLLILAGSWLATGGRPPSGLVSAVRRRHVVARRRDPGPQQRIVVRRPRLQP